MRKPTNHIFYLLILIVIISDGYSSAQTKPVCYQCRKYITGKYIIAEGKTFHPDHFLCAACGKLIEGKYQFKDGKFYHVECYSSKEGFVCDYCKKVLTDSYISSNNKKYHPDCYRDHILEKCSICYEPMQGEIIIDSYSNKYHARHKNELPECDCCSRLICEALTGGGKRYGDGRNICNICYCTAVFDDSQISSLLSKVKSKLMLMGLNFGSNPISIRGVDRNELMRNANNYSKNTQGYCDSQSEIMTANGVVKSKSTRHKIMGLNGIPRILMESIIAHELMHAWIFDHSKTKWNMKTVEGSCNYIRYLYLKSMPQFQSAEYIRLMNVNPDPIYGDGYREIKARFENRTIKEFLDFIQK